MGYQYSHLAAAHAPGDLNQSQRTVLLVIAEDARPDCDGRSTLSRAELCRRANLKQDSVGRVLTTLAKQHGLELRTAIGRDENGHQIFAAHGHAVAYRFPYEFWKAEPPCKTCPPDGPMAGCRADHSRQKAEPKPGRTADQRGGSPAVQPPNSPEARPYNRERSAVEPRRSAVQPTQVRSRDSVDDPSNDAAPAIDDDNAIERAAEFCARETGMRVLDTRTALRQLGKRDPRAWAQRYVANGDQENLRNVLTKAVRTSQTAHSPPAPTTTTHEPMSAERQKQHMDEITNILSKKTDLNAS